MSAGEMENPSAIISEQVEESLHTSADQAEEDIEDEQWQQPSSTPEGDDAAGSGSSRPLRTLATTTSTTPTTTAAPWANVGVSSNESSQQQHQAKSFADIMAEQNEDLAAAQAAYGSAGAALVDVEAEQERAFQALKLQQAPKQQPPPLSLPNPEDLDLTEEEMIVLVMEQSLAEYEEKTLGLPADPIQEIDTSIPEEEPAKCLSPKLLPRSISPLPDHHRTTVKPRPLLGDKEFSKRHLKAIERTAIEIDIPHVEVDSPRARASRKSISAPRGGGERGRRSLIRRTKSSMEVTADDNLQRPTVACRRAMMMESAKKHLSLREIHEIDHALREAEEEEGEVQQQRKLSPHSSFHQATSRRRRSSFSSPSPARNTFSSSSPPRNTSTVLHPSSVNASFLDLTTLDLTTIESPVQPETTRPNMAISAEEAASIEVALREADAIEAALQEADSMEAALREADAIEAALQEADAKAEMESMMLAQQMQIEAFIEANHVTQSQSSQQQQGNVRCMTRAQLEYESERVNGAYQGSPSRTIGAMHAAHPPPLHPLEVEPEFRSMFPPAPQSPPRHPLEDETNFEEGAGFRMNSSTPSQWARRDRNTIVGPNGEVRSKHDVHAQGQANAHSLGLDADDFGIRAHVGNKAFNSFKKNMKRSTKGVAKDGTGRAGSDADATKGKAMDPHVRLQISRAINSGLIDKCNGVVKQGKEAMVYHANEGENSEGFDVAVKVFKRIQEFRGRADYVEGDPRYAKRSFRKASEREQLEIWTEKEFRNLVRANRAKVPVPIPLHYKENILFMRFMGNNGWPAPQIRELEIRKGSKKWELLYSQVMESIRR
jgi:serine/threonine-protein kinase RIO1